MKQELERIWMVGPIAFTTHIAGWLTITECKQRNLGYYVPTDEQFISKIRGKKINPPNRDAGRKFRIWKHQLKG